MAKGLSRAEVATLCGCKVGDIPTDPVYNVFNFHAPGPVGQAYILSQGPIDMITGPAGSGKTVASIFKPLRFSVASMPVGKDGVIRVRGTVLRDNYRALYRTTLRSWFEFIPPDYGGAVFTGGQDRPAQHVLKLSTVRMFEGAMRELPVDLTVDFFAVGDVNIEELLKAYETSWVYVDEGDMLHPRVISFSYSRTGRYPPLETLPEGTRRPRMVAVSFNPPDIDHPIWQAAQRGSFNLHLPVDEHGKVSAEHRTVNFFHQPSGLSKEAENRSGKSFEAYQEEAMTLTEEDVRRFVHGQPGYALDGRPVYAKEFDMRRHVAAGTLAVIPGLPLHIGFDQGLSPGAIFFQEATTGQLRVYAEVIPEKGTGISRFLQMLFPLLQGRFRDLPPGHYTSDPSGFYGADKIGGEVTWSDAVGKGLGHFMRPAETNEPALRIEAVKLALSQNIEANVPALIIDPCCRTLISGFAAHYKYRRIKGRSSDRYEDFPYKNCHQATAHDSFQYGVLGVRGRAGIINQAAKAGRAGNVVPMSHGRATKAGDFNVWTV